MQNTWLTLLPPLIVLLFALITRKITNSLIIGIMSAAFIAKDFTTIPSIKLILERVTDLFKDPDNYFFISLIFILGMIISLITKTGGIQALGDFIIKKSTSKKSAEKSSIFLSLILCIDDYLNMLTVGHVMRPLTDKYKIPRVKLAYYAATLAGCLAIFVPISTWLGVIIGQLSASGISQEAIAKPTIFADPFFVYVQSIQFIFYSIISIISVFFIAQKRISYGPIHVQEEIANNTGNVFGGKKAIDNIKIEPNNCKVSILDFFIPMISLICSILIGLAYSGGFHLLGGINSLLKAFQSANAQYVLFVSGLVTFILTLIFSLLRKKIILRDSKEILKTGYEMMISSVILIVLSLIFGSFLKQDLKTGSYLANLLMGSINLKLLPVMIFLVSCSIGVAIGSTWGTIAIMVPIIVPMIVSFSSFQTPINAENLIYLFPCLGSIFSGAVAGNHLSPISDSTIMASSSAGCYTTDLLKIRYYYTLPIVFSTALAFVLNGQLIEKSYKFALVAAIIAGLLSAIIILQLCNAFFNKTKN